MTRETLTRPLPRRGPLWLAAALLLGFALPGSAAPPSLRITGRLASAVPAGARIELHLASPGFEGEVRRLGGAPEPAPLASIPFRAHGAFELAAPGPGFYRVVVRAEGRLAMAQELIPLVEDRELEPLQLPPADRLRVKAVGAGGEPLAGLAVGVVTSCCAGANWDPAPRRGITGADGGLDLPRAPGEVLDLAILSPAYLGQGARQVRGDAITLTLRPSPLVRLEVRSPGGRPAAGALVRWRGWAVGITGPRGRFALTASGAGEGPLSVGTAAGEWAEILPERLASPAAGPVVVRLEAPMTTAGRVVDAATGEPVAGALVWTRFSRLVAPPAISGADGRFQLLRPAEPRGPAWVWAAAPGYLDGFSAEPAVEGTRIPLLAGTALAGSVVDSAGRPVVGVQVEARSRGIRRPPGSYSLSPAEAWTRPDGSFRLNGLVAGDDHELIVQAEGFAPAVIAVTGSALPRVGRPASPVRIVLSQGQTATGQVVDPAGRPVPGAEVLLLTVSQTYEKLTFRASSDSSGRFEIPRIVPGRFELVLRHPAFATLQLPGVEIAAGPGDSQRTDLGLLRLESGALLEGRVTDPAGRPLPGAQLALLPAGITSRSSLLRQLAESSTRPTATTDAEGRFRVTGLRKGELYEVQVVLPGYLLEGDVRSLAPQAEPLRLVLTRSRSLSGRVVGPEGEPVLGASVTARRQQGQATRLLGGTRSGDNGEFRIQGLTPGPLELTVSAVRGYQERRLEEMELPLERDLTGIEAVLEKAPAPEPAAIEAGARDVEEPADRPEKGTVTGRLVGVGRGDLARVEVRAWRSATAIRGEVGAGGTYRVRDLIPGEWGVEAVRDSGRPVRGFVQVEPGATVEGPDLDLSGLTLTGRVLVDGEPPAGAAIRVMGPGGLREVAVTTVAQDGRFRLVGLAPGPSQLILVTPFGVQFHPFEAAADLDLPLTLATGRLTGRVVSAAGEPMANARVKLSSMELNAEGVATDEQGAFSIPRAFAGSPELSVFVDRRVLLRSPVEVKAGAETYVELRLPGGD